MAACPEHDVTDAALSTGAVIVVRPIRPDDEGMMVRFHEGLSDRSVYQRYFHMMTLAHRTAHARLSRVCHADFDREFVLVAAGREHDRGGGEILGVARLQRSDDGRTAEFALVVADRHQASGVGSALMRQIIAVARREGCARLRADILADNGPMRRLCTRLGLSVHPTADPLVVEADLAL
jgi:acetyltransferase